MPTEKQSNEMNIYTPYQNLEPAKEVKEKSSLSTVNVCKFVLKSLKTKQKLR